MDRQYGDVEIERLVNAVNRLTEQQASTNDKLDKIYSVVVGNGNETNLLMRMRLAEERLKDAAVQRAKSTEDTKKSMERIEVAVEDNKKAISRLETTINSWRDRGLGIVVGLSLGSATIATLVTEAIKAIVN